MLARALASCFTMAQTCIHFEIFSCGANVRSNIAVPRHEFPRPKTMIPHSCLLLCHRPKKNAFTTTVKDPGLPSIIYYSSRRGYAHSKPGSLPSLPAKSHPISCSSGRLLGQRPFLLLLLLDASPNSSIAVRHGKQLPATTQAG